MVEIRSKKNGQRYPLRPSTGISQSDFKEGKNVGGPVVGPYRKFGRAAPRSQLGTVKVKVGYVKSLSSRIKKHGGAAKARKEQKEKIKDAREERANKNYKLAAQFFSAAEKERKGEEPEPIDITLNVDEPKPTLPKNLTKEEKEEKKKENEKQFKKESSVISRLNEPPPPPPKPISPIFPIPEEIPEPPPVLTAEEPKGEPAASVLNSSKFSPLQNPSRGPDLVTQPSNKNKSKLDLAELALLNFPPSG